MALDPQVKAFLDQMKAAGGPKMQDAGPVAGREMFAGLMQMVGPKDVPVGKTENRTIPGVGGVHLVEAKIWFEQSAGSFGRYHETWLI